MPRIISFSYTNQDLFKQAFAVRQAVFVVEQGVPAALEYDEHEPEATHYLLYEDETPIGAARWRKTDHGIKLERFAVLPEYRNKGLGEALVKKVLGDVIPLGQPVYLHSQLKACTLYERHGFIISGGKFYEAGMAHYKMVLKK